LRFTHDGKRIYFVSDMVGGQRRHGHLVSATTGATANWAEPQNMGTKVNTPGG
jgi:hypothetical protein